MKKSKNSKIEQIHSDYLPNLILFHDKWLVLTMREIIGMMKMTRMVQNFLDSMPKEDAERFTELIKANNFRDIPIVKSILDTVDLGGARIGDQPGPGFSAGGGKSLFNFSGFGGNGSL